MNPSLSFRQETAEDIAGKLDEAGLEVMLDDRAKVSAGVKFRDAELIGIPTTVVVGRGVADGVVEVKDRATGEAENIALDAVVEHVAQLAAH